MNLKLKIYSLFQFLSLSAIVCFLIGIFLFSIHAYKSSQNINFSFWLSELKMLLKFSVKYATSLVGSVFIYISFALTISSLCVGFLVLSLKNRNYFDTMFLLFVGIPLISNVFCLLAQMFLHENKITSYNLDKREIEKEKTQIIKILNEEGILRKKDSEELKNKIKKSLTKKAKAKNIKK